MVKPSKMQAEAFQAAAAADRLAAQLQPQLRELGAVLRALDPLLVMTCARGSSDHAATYAKHLIETRLRIPAASHTPSISSVYETKWRSLERTVFLAISQSGRSPDLLISAKVARQAGALILAVVNDESSPLFDEADHAIPLVAGPERSVAATKSYISSLLVALLLVAEWVEDDALAQAVVGSGDLLRAAWSLDWSIASPILIGAQSLYVVGRGSTLGIAQEAALKLKETSAIHAEAVSAAEIRHGPLALVKNGFPTLMFVPADAAAEGFADLAQLLVECGATVICAGAQFDGCIELPTVAGVHPALAPVAMIQSFYRLAATVSVGRGCDPDHPAHLHKVTRTR